MPRKTLGTASYRAYRLFGATHLVASGQVPNFNDKVEFEQLPFRIFPPIWAFYVITQDVTLPAVRPFLLETVIPFPASATAITIQDAQGMHTVPIAEVVTPPLLAVETDGGAGYCVFQWIGTNKLLAAKCDAILPAVWTRVFGPASSAECDQYIQSHGGVSTFGLMGHSNSGVKVDFGNFQAWINRMPPGPAKLIVTGAITVPTTGWSAKLARATPQGFNPNILLLDLELTPPTGPALDVVTTIPLRFEEEPPARDYSAVTIKFDGNSATIGVGIAS